MPAMPQVAYAKSDIPISITPTFINPNTINMQSNVAQPQQVNKVQANQQQPVQRPVTPNVNPAQSQRVTFPVGNNVANNMNRQMPNQQRVNQQINNVNQMQRNQMYAQNMVNRNVVNQNAYNNIQRQQNNMLNYNAQQDFRNKANSINPFIAARQQNNQFQKAEDSNMFDTEQVIYDNGVEEKKVDRAYQNYYAESRRENKLSPWQKFINSKFVQSIKYLFKIKVVLQLPESTAENKNNV